LERPPAIRVKVRGRVSPGTWATNHSVTLATLMPSGWLDTVPDANAGGWGPTEGTGRTGR